MTIEEASDRYNIPVEVLREYESWGLCRKGERKADGTYSEETLTQLSTLMTLHGIGFNSEQVERYMHLLSQGSTTAEERLEMLEEKRNGTLQELHQKQEQLDRVDYLRYEIKKTQKERRKKR